MANEKTLQKAADEVTTLMFKYAASLRHLHPDWDDETCNASMIESVGQELRSKYNLTLKEVADVLYRGSC